ncbi:MAG TPA: response regulator transcription factor [Vicinamibacterales bacterium]|nr:response regulator transcription factor [Vicinamibacterales bacterium]
MRIRVMLVERSTLVRSGLRRILDDGDIAVIADVGDVPEAIEALASHNVDVVVICTAIDRDACRASTIASLRRAADLGIVCVRHWADTRDVDAALSAGALACVEMSDAREDDLRNAVRLVSQSKRYLSPRLQAAPPINGSSFEADYERLTAREREVLVLVARSLSNREIARELRLSVNTVAVHRNHIMKKIGVRKATALALFAAERGLLPRN